MAVPDTETPCEGTRTATELDAQPFHVHDLTEAFIIDTIDHCPVCAGTALTTLRQHTFRHPGPDIERYVRDFDFPRFTLWVLFEKILRRREPVTFDMRQCDACGFIFSHPRFTEAELALKYQSYNELGADRTRENVRPSTRQEERAERVHRLVSPHLRRGDRMRLLDYGGCSGDMLRPFTGDCDCQLLDYADTTLAPGVEKIGASIEDLAPDDRFHGILLLHTLEHVPDPADMLRRLAAHLHDDGVLYVEVPLGCFGEWKFLTEPLMHLNYFSEQSAWRCMEEAGLYPIQVDTSYQWVTHNKIWCVNLLGSKTPRESSRRPLPTRKQLNRLMYYLPYLMNPAVVRKVWRKILSG